MKRNFLVVAQSGKIREALARDLRAKGYSVTRAASGAEAEQVVRSVSVDAALVESHIQDMTPDELRKRLLQQRPDCRVFIVTSFDLIRNSPEQLKFGGADYLVRGEQLFELVGAPFEGHKGVSATTFAQRGNQALIDVIDVMVGLLEIDDRYFGGTSHKASRLAREVAEELSADEQTIQEVVLATLLRDVGKVGIEPEIFSQQGSLSEKQLARMREHVEASLRLFEHIDFPWKVMPIIRHHHERYDGTGYPDGLRGREIPLGGRIVAVVDSYVALTSDRYHREAVDPELALQKLVRAAGRQFDPEVVEAFQKVLDKRLEMRRPKRKPRVLLADSQKDFRRLLKMRLVNEGLEVHEKRTCDQALKVMKKDPPDLVLVDVDADSNESFQLFEEIREDASLCRIPFVFLSRSSDRVLKMRALRQGVDDFLCKGDDLDELVVRVQNILIREAIRRDGVPRRKRRGITGELENLSLPDIIQTLVMGMKSARVMVASESRQGTIWFDNGAAIHASTDGKEGEDAFFEMVRWTSGEFVIEHGLRSKKSSLGKDTMFLLMEGLRLMDERNDPARASAVN